MKQANLSRNRTKRIFYWKDRNEDWKHPWPESETMSRPAPDSPTSQPTLVLLSPTEQWIHCWRSFAQLLLKPETNAIAVVVPVSRNATRSVSLQDKRCQIHQSMMEKALQTVHLQIPLSQQRLMLLRPPLRIARRMKTSRTGQPAFCKACARHLPDAAIRTKIAGACVG